MGWRPQLNTFCTRCQKAHKPWETCVTSSARPAGFRIKLSFGKCPKCRKSYDQGGALTHHCAPRSDFKRRKSQFESEQAKKAREAARKARPKHEYQECGDDECKRSACVAFKAGREIGDEAGFERGWELGHARGIDDCPRGHK
jgi:hypothetical protein